MMNKQQGMSLLELMLVLTIGVAFVLMGIRTYDMFQFQANEQKIAANVNQLFVGLAGFYAANCRQALDVNSNPQSAGALDPNVSNVNTVVLSVSGDLIGTNFVSSSSWQPNNPLLDNTPSPDKGYYVQFNRVLISGADPAMSASMCTGNTVSSSCNATNGLVISTSNAPSSQSHAVTWVAQVGVKLATNLTTAQWTQIQNDLSAACISSAAGSGIAQCTPTPAAGGYLVWTRVPSAYFDRYMTSDYWTSMPYVKEFNMQYTNDGMATLSGVTNETTSGAKTWYNPLYYLCGG